MAKKQILSLVAASLLAATFVGCGSSSNSTGGTTTPVAVPLDVTVSDAYVYGATVTKGGVEYETADGAVYSWADTPEGDLMSTGGANDLDSDGKASDGDANAIDMKAAATYTNINPFTTLEANGKTLTEIELAYGLPTGTLTTADINVVEADLAVYKAAAKAALEIAAGVEMGSTASGTTDTGATDGNTTDGEATDGEATDCLPGQDCTDTGDTTTPDDTNTTDTTDTPDVVNPDQTTPARPAVAFREQTTPSRPGVVDTNTTDTTETPDTGSTTNPDQTTPPRPGETTDTTDTTTPDDTNTTDDGDTPDVTNPLATTFAAIDGATDKAGVNAAAAAKMIALKGAYVVPGSDDQTTPESPDATDDTTDGEATDCLPGQDCTETPDVTDGEATDCLPGQDCTETPATEEPAVEEPVTEAPAVEEPASSNQTTPARP